MSHKLTKRQVRSIRKMLEHKGQHERRKEESAQRRLARARGDGKPPRRRDWIDNDEYASREAMRAPGREVKLDAPAISEDAPVAAGTVIEVRSGDSLVSTGGRTVRALLPLGARVGEGASRSPIAVGDRVELTPIDGETARIVALLLRRSALTRHSQDASRREPLGRRQVIAANIDQVIVVCSPAEPPFRPGLIDRYLVAASRDALTPIICLNKVDLGVTLEIEELLAGYERLGVRAVRTSASATLGLDDLRQCLARCVSLLAGHSGVGKSSLLNAIEPGLALRTGDVTHATAGQGKGRHTTSSARLLALSTPETFVVDSPGIRAYSVRGIPQSELAGHFRDLAALAGACSYRDCLHESDAGCAVAAGAAEGDAFLRRRLTSYRSMLHEVS